MSTPPTTRRGLSRREFLRLSAASAVATAAPLLLGTAYGTRVGAFLFELQRLELTLPRLAPAFDGFTVMQLSDIHADGETMTAARFAQALELVDVQPDLLVVTGDFITRAQSGSRVAEILALLAQIRPRAGTMAVLGNHDHWSGPREVRRLLERHGVQELNDTVQSLRRGEARLHIAGIDDLWPDHHRWPNLAEARPRLERVAAQLPAQGAALLLAHEPDVADLAAELGRFDLQLSGHSHGGQVRLPGRGALITPPLGQKYDCGHYQIGPLQLYTNRGLGMVSPHVRINCNPEVALVTLRAGAPA